MTKLTFATTRLRERRVRRDAGIDDRDADALPVHSRECRAARPAARFRRASDPPPSTRPEITVELCTRRSPDRWSTAPSRDRSVSSALFARTTAAPRIRLTTVQPVTRGQQIELAPRPVHDDALARLRLARLVFGQISREVRPPVGLRANEPRRGKCDQGSDGHDEADGLYGHGLTTRHMETWISVHWQGSDLLEFDDRPAHRKWSVLRRDWRSVAPSNLRRIETLNTIIGASNSRN